MTDNKHRMNDEQLGKELESLISGNVESVTPPAGTFLAIQDRLGSQDADWSPSRLIGRLLPGEWGLPMFTGMVMKVTAAIVVAIAIAAVLVFQGRDTDQGEIVPAAESTAVATPTVEPEFEFPTVLVNAPFEGALVVPAIEPESGSPEVAILDTVERVVRAINLDDWAGLLSTCDPRLASLLSPTAVEQIWDSSVGPSIAAGAYNRRDATIKLFDDDTANVNFSEYSYDQLMFENILESYSEVDGRWYLSNVYCHGGNARLVEPVVEPVESTDPIQNPPDITALPVRDLPAELDPDRATEQPSEDRVIELWTEYLSDSILPIDNFFPNIGDLHFCGDGSVMAATGLNNNNLLLGEPDTWYVARSAAMSSSTWWEVVLTVLWGPDSGTSDPKLPLITLKINEGSPSADFLTTTRELLVYESEYCKTLGG